MAVYFVTGKLGCGKTLCAVGKIRDYLEQGRRVATNLDINLPAMTKRDSKVSIIRVPDKPTLRDLELIGDGCQDSNESQYGLLVLDELGTWFNSRNWRDKERLDVIDWFLHARKKHWDIFFIVQNINSLDDQLVSALCEHLVICKRTDRLSIPVIGSIFKTLGIQKVFPKIHVAKVYYGQTTSSMAVDRWWYRGKDLYPAYNTDQIFSDKSDGVHSVLPSYYRNNIALINHHEAEIKFLTADLKTGRPPAGRSLKMSASIAFSVFLCLVGFRTYAKYQDITIGHHPIEVQPVSENKPVDSTPKQTATVQTSGEIQTVQQDHTDYIQKITKNAEITATSYYFDNSKLNAIFHVKQGEQTTMMTLDDVRAYGYAAVVQGSMIYVTKNTYGFSFKKPLS